MDGKWEENGRNRRPWQERKRNVTRPSSLLVVCYEEKEHSSTFEWLVFRSGKGLLGGRYDERKEQNRPRKSSNNVEDFNETPARCETIPNFYAQRATKTRKKKKKKKRKQTRKTDQLLLSLQLCERPWKNFLEEFEIKTLVAGTITGHKSTGKLMDRHLVLITWMKTLFSITPLDKY